MSYFSIDEQKEHKDTRLLFYKIRESKWVDENTVIVNCSPDYSSIICQFLQHNLSPNNKPLKMEYLEMPYPNQETYTKEQMMHDAEILMLQYASQNKKFLFVDSGCLRGSNFTLLAEVVGDYVGDEDRRFACLYLQEDSIFLPDFYVETFNFKLNGGLLFWWENPNNPYWPW
jgi:hypothetical protein